MINKVSEGVVVYEVPGKPSLLYMLLLELLFFYLLKLLFVPIDILW